MGTETHRGDERWELRIVDSGPGMNDEQRQNVTEPLYTTKKDGLGLGAAIALGVARLHGGGLEYSATSPKGTVACLCIPIEVEQDSQV